MTGASMRILMALALAAGVTAPSTIAEAPDYSELGRLGRSFCHSNFGGMVSRFQMPHLGFCAEPTIALARMNGFGTGGFTISTHVAEVQAWFDFGMRLAHAFNHKGAVEAFHQA